MKNRIDKKLFLLLLGYMAAYHVVYISRRVILKFMNEPGYVDTSWSGIVFGPILCNFLIIPPIIILILLATKWMIQQRLSWFSSLCLHFSFSLLYVFLVIFLNTIYNYFVYGDPLELFSRVALVNILYGSTLNFLGYVGFVSIIYSYYYIAKTGNAETQKAQLAEQLQIARMEALKSQLNPHFLFNTLNSISALIKENGHKAQHMIGNLGDLLREVLVVRHENLIPLKKELLILNKYLEIMQVRFSDDLSIGIQMDEDLGKALVPTMILQPIVENSLKYGYSYEKTNLKIALSVHKMNEKIRIEVENNGAALPDTGIVEGTGIQNIRDRLETLYKSDFFFSVKNLKASKGVITTIEIPFEKGY